MSEVCDIGKLVEAVLKEFPEKFRARFYRWKGFRDEDGESAPDLNRWYIAISDLEEAGELELWF